MYTMWVLAKNNMKYYQSDIFEVACRDIFKMVHDFEDPIHPQITAILLEYFMMGGRLKIENYLPRLHKLLPSDFSQTPDGNKLSEATRFGKRIQNMTFYEEYFLHVHYPDTHTIGRLLFFMTLILHKKYYNTCFELFFLLKDDLASRLSVKCLGLNSKFRHTSSAILYYHKGKDNPRRFEQCHRMMIDMWEGIAEEIENSKKHENNWFSKVPMRLDNNDYKMSTSLLKCINILRLTEAGDPLVISLVSIHINLIFSEIREGLDGTSAMSPQTIYNLWKLLDLLCLPKLQEEAIEMMFTLSSTSVDYLDSLFRNKLVQKYLQNLSAEQIQQAIKDKFGKHLIYNAEHLREAREALIDSWGRFAFICNNINTTENISHLIDQFDSLSVFHCKSDSRSLGDRHIITPPNNTFFRDIRIHLNNPIQSIYKKVSHILIEPRNKAMDIREKNTTYTIIKSMEKSLSSCGFIPRTFPREQEASQTGEY